MDQPILSKRLTEGHFINTGHHLTGYLRPLGGGLYEIVRTCCPSH